MSKPDAVYFFGTCLIDLLYPRAGLSAMQLLARAGIRVRYPQGQTCCGQPAYNSGYRDQARVVAAAQLDAFPANIPVVVPAASCAGMFRVHYQRLFAGTTDEERALALVGRVYEFTEFLVRTLDLRPVDLGPPLDVVLHNSCSARRELGVADAALELLDRLANIRALEPDHADECCGFGGTFAVKEPQLSAAMAADKTAAIAAAGAPLLVGQDCGCLMNLEGTFRRRGSGPQVKHIAELVWERTNGG